MRLYLVISVVWLSQGLSCQGTVEGVVRESEGAVLVVQVFSTAHYRPHHRAFFQFQDTPTNQRLPIERCYIWQQSAILIYKKENKTI